MLFSCRKKKKKEKSEAYYDQGSEYKNNFSNPELMNEKANFVTHYNIHWVTLLRGNKF